MEKDRSKKKFEFIAFDADDTLWHNEPLFSITQSKFKELLLPFHSEEWVNQRLYETEVRNLNHFGYGVKAFTLSMIETAIELSEGRISGADIQSLIDAAKTMVQAPIQLMDGVGEVLPQLAENFKLMVITKGDLFDQESKIARSGLGRYFRHIEIVSEKNESTYEGIFNKHGVEPSQFLMIGNSLKSDVLPPVALGASAIHIPYEVTWAHERVDADPAKDGYLQMKSIREVSEWLQ